MAEKITVPTLGESVTEATVSKWLKSQGDKVTADEPLVELETDKVNVEVPSPTSGVLGNINVKEGETVLITGASGGVGSAAIQLAKRRGARVVAISSKAKSVAVIDIGADEVIHREDKLKDSIDNETIDVVIDLVAGENWGCLLDALKKGGRYAAAGAIAGPIVELDVRTLYLKDLVLIGCTFQNREVFQNLIGYIERNEIKPLVSKTYPLKNIVNAQKDFVSKKYVGKLVLLP